MANHISSLKRARQTETKTAVNRANKSKLRGTLRTLREAIATGDATAATAQYRATVSILDKGVQKGTLHKNTASRYKSRLNARLKAVGTTSATAKPVKAKAKPAAKKAVAKKKA
jgi:small subunit ribosomal protein S20